MQPFEWLVFMCRITFEHYKGTVYENELMYIKLEKFLPKWLFPINQTPIFVMGCEFEYDLKVAKRKERLRRIAEGISSEEGEDEEYDSEEEEAMLIERARIAEEEAEAAEEAAVLAEEKEQARIL